jgi:glycosyltransferase involved in cell wall biosynthesis
MNLINIILAAYNGETYIREQIDSILNNTFTNWILWIFDDGSIDNTQNIIEEYKKTYKDKIQYIRNIKNKGHALNFLEGVSYASQHYKPIYDKMKIEYPDFIQNNGLEKKYYMFCDQDDVWMPNKIEITLKHMKKLERNHGEHKVLAVFTDAVVVDERLNTLHPSFYEVGKLNTKNVELAHIMMENKMIGCTVLFNEALFLKMHTIPQNARYHDWWVALIAASFGSISFLPSPTLYYRQHSNNVVGNQTFLAYVMNRITSLKKQREVLLQTINQAKEFYSIYEKEISNKSKMQIYAFANLWEFDWFTRRKIMLKFGFLKSGIVRNIGLMLII